MNAARSTAADPARWDDWSCPICGGRRGEPCRTRTEEDRALPHLRRLLLWAAGWLVGRIAAAADPDDRLRLARVLLAGGHTTNHTTGRATTRGGPWGPVADRFAGLAAVQSELAGYVPVVIRLETHQVRTRLRDDADSLVRARKAAALLAGGSLPNQLRSGARPSWPLTPEQILELVDVDELLQVLPAVRRRRTHAEVLARPPANDPPLWTVRYERENGVYEAVLARPAWRQPAATRDDEHPHGGSLARLIGVGDVPAVVEDLLRQCSVPAGGPVRIRWTGDEGGSRLGMPRREATVWEHPELPHDRDERVHAIAGSAQRKAEMTTALRELRAVLDPDDVPVHLVETARRAQADQPPTPPIVLDDLEDCLAQDRHAARGIGWDWVDSAAIVNAGNLAWGAFADHRPERMALIARRLLTAEDPWRAAVRTFAEEPMRLVRVQGPAGPIYEVDSNGLHRAHLARLLPLPWVFADIRLVPLPWAVEPSWEYGDELTTLWRGLLRHGLVAGRLATDPVVRLDLDWAAAPWLLATAETACAINRAYERVYPGAWAAVGVPPGVADDPGRWTAWLTAE